MQQLLLVIQIFTTFFKLLKLPFITVSELKEARNSTETGRLALQSDLNKGKISIIWISLFLMKSYLDFDASNTRRSSIFAAMSKRRQSAPAIAGLPTNYNYSRRRSSHRILPPLRRPSDTPNVRVVRIYTETASGCRIGVDCASFDMN